MQALSTFQRDAGNHRGLGEVHSRLITAIYVVGGCLVGVAIASLIAIAIVSQLASSLPVSRFRASANPPANGMS